MNSNRKRDYILLTLVFLVGTVYRSISLSLPHLWSDEANIGLMARDVASGTFFPIFFYAQAFMGSLEAYLYAGLFHLFGPTTRTMELLPFLVVSLIIISSGILAYRIYGYRTALLTVLFLSFAPSYFARWNFEARPHYSLTVLFGTLLFLFTYNLIYGKARHKLPHYILIGFFCGIGWWTNFLIAIYILTIAMFLFLNDKKILFRKYFWLLVLFFLIGSAPFWYFNVTHSFVSLHLRGMREMSQIPAQISRVMRIALPDTVGLDQPPHSYFHIALYVLTGLFYVSSILSEIFKRRKGLRNMLTFSLKNTTGAEMLVVHTILFLGILSLSHYGRRIGTLNSPYMLAFYPFIIIILASSLTDIGKKWKPAFVVFTGIILLANIYNTVRSPCIITRGGFARFNAAALSTHRAYAENYRNFVRFIKENDLWFVYGDGLVPTFYSGERILFANPYQNFDPRRARLVDAAGRIAWAPADKIGILKDTLNAIGAKYDENEKLELLYNFTELYEDYAEIEPEDFEAKASPNGVNAHLALDRNILTRWTSNCPRAPGMFYQLDIGKIHPVCKITMLPGFWRDCPRGYRLEISSDGDKWKEIVSVEKYWGPLFWSGPHPFLKIRRGRVETIFPAVNCRFIRVTQTGSSKLYHWSINEIYVYGQRESTPMPRDIHALVNFLQKHNVKFACADHWLSANIGKLTKGKIGTYPSNRFTGRNRESFPAPGTIEPITPVLRIAIVVETKTADSIAKTLERSHISFTKTKTGGYTVFLNLKREKPDCGEILPENWQAASNRNPDLARYAFDGDPETRWHSGKAQEPGMYLQVDLGEARNVSTIKLTLGENRKDYPRGLFLETSADGKNWKKQRISVSGDGLYWSGFSLLQLYDREITLDFTPHNCRYLKLTLTARTNTYWWSISEILIYPAKGSIPHNPR